MAITLLHIYAYFLLLLYGSAEKWKIDFDFENIKLCSSKIYGWNKESKTFTVYDTKSREQKNLIGKYNCSIINVNFNRDCDWVTVNCLPNGVGYSLIYISIKEGFTNITNLQKVPNSYNFDWHKIQIYSFSKELFLFQYYIRHTINKEDRFKPNIACFNFSNSKQTQTCSECLQLTTNTSDYQHLHLSSLFRHG